MVATRAMVVSGGVLVMIMTLVISYEVSIVPGILESINYTKTLPTRCACKMHCMVDTSCQAVSVLSNITAVTCFFGPLSEAGQVRVVEEEGAYTILKKNWSERVIGSPPKTTVPGLRGKWKPMIYCPPGLAVSSASVWDPNKCLVSTLLPQSFDDCCQSTESKSKGSFVVFYDSITYELSEPDNIGLSKIEIGCSNRRGQHILHVESGFDYMYSKKRGPWNCPKASEVVGVKYGIQKVMKEYGDNVGVVGLQLHCNDRNNTILTLLDASDIKAYEVGWSQMMMCPPGFEACGFSLRSDRHPRSVSDSSGVCEIKMDCCHDEVEVEEVAQPTQSTFRAPLKTL